jgi:hypothetical protein
MTRDLLFASTDYEIKRLQDLYVRQYDALCQARQSGEVAPHAVIDVLAEYFASLGMKNPREKAADVVKSAEVEAKASILEATRLAEIEASKKLERINKEIQGFFKVYFTVFPDGTTDEGLFTDLLEGFISGLREHGF